MAKTKPCLEWVTKKLSKNKFKKVFKMFDQIISLANLDKDQDIRTLYATTAAQFRRTDKAFSLGDLPWEDYNVSNSQVIVRAMSLAKILCKIQPIIDIGLFPLPMENPLNRLQQIYYRTQAKRELKQFLKEVNRLKRKK